MAFIEFHHLYKIFGHNPQAALSKLKKHPEDRDSLIKTGHTAALRDISLSIEKGETFVVMGLSGSGKSTLIRCLNRLIEPTAGKILIDGQDVMNLNQNELRELRRHKMSMVFQRFALLPHRSVLENMAYGLEIQGVPKQEREERAMQWVDSVGLSGWEKSYPRQLSGGMQQRVGIGRALCTDPEVLLMDEPFSALDPLIRREMQDELLALEGRIHKTTIFITHDLDEALRLGDRIAILKDGLLVQVGTPEDILSNPADDYVADFTRDVNRIRVLSASNVMISPHQLVIERGGPRAALKFMQREGLSSVFVTNREMKLEGLLALDEALEAAQKGMKNVRELLYRQEIQTTAPDTGLEELLPSAIASRWPIAVVNEQNVLLGVIPRVAVLAALAGDDTPEEVMTEQEAIWQQV
ncbi:ABC transporter ATP-binding protein [candidate division KSB3 bacterium]|uniref:ABC transporter ATP-binding protein n=1 Tax=candidate division KSB3 bacterium TaxID=2044937 RepID=A0A2G6K8I4_9BACT|nr:MAG: ABC transporter ATP-binding protein [candidate division KSB3 bacterium]